MYGDRHVVCGNGAYYLRSNDTDEVIESFPISQDDEGVDVEDRVVLLKGFIELVSEG